MFIIQTTIDHKAMTVQARVNRKTLRRGSSFPVRTLAWFVVALEAFLTAAYLRGGFGSWLPNTLMGLFMLGCLLLEDRISGAVGLSQISPEKRVVNTTFQDSAYVCRTQAGENWYTYSAIQALAETKDYFVLLLDRRHGQIYDKNGFSWGNLEEFRAFLQKKTGHRVQQIK